MNTPLCAALLALLLGTAGQVPETPVPPPEEPAMPAPRQFRRDASGSPIIPMVFPVVGKTSWVDTFNPSGGGGRRRHHGQDLMAPKLRPLVAVFDGYVSFARRQSGHNMLSIQGDDGYYATYMHINNDNPGTDDGLGSMDYAYAPGLQSGDRVHAGQLLAWVGDSGNAETTAPHCHFELWGPEGCVNPAPSLRAARKLEAPLLRPAELEEARQPGEVRWEGVVREFNPEWRLAVLDLLAVSDASGRLVSVTAPRRQWVRLKDARLTSRAAEPLTPEQVVPGCKVSVLGRHGEKGKAALGRVAAFDIAVGLDAGTVAGGQ